ncbi:DUF3052 domain-containing protein [Streptomyces sp. NPDC012794]|uniref:DUF3052 domain-containing protein n=1 Tax=Streptomyces sp. NPDC012794 TaxID=3364850 RepID=UPI003693522A
MTTPSGPARRLGIEPGMAVMELGYDHDVDDGIRDSVTERTGRDLVTDDHEDRVDAVLLWWREGDGDLACELDDLRRVLTVRGAVWVLTAQAGFVGHVEASDIAECARQVGMHTSAPVDVSGGWTGTRCAPQGYRNMA